jgi:hypothetical protein
MGEMKNSHYIFVRKPNGKRPLGKLRCRKEDNISLASQENRVGTYGLGTSGKLL